MYLSHDKFDASEMTLGNPSKKELCFNWGILTFDKTLRTVTEETSPRGKVTISEKKENIGRRSERVNVLNMEKCILVITEREMYPTLFSEPRFF